MYGSILFTDIVGSSESWNKNPQNMKRMLNNHFNLVNKLSKQNDGFIVKTIGDAFMLFFKEQDSLYKAIKCGIEIIKQEVLPLRIGICYGQMDCEIQNIQNSKLKDFFGNTVNTASRMESKISSEGGITFSYTEPITEAQSEKIKKLLDENKMTLTKIKFSSDCSQDSDVLLSTSTRYRSNRLLTDIQLESCKNINLLKGIRDIMAFTFNVKGKKRSSI